MTFPQELPAVEKHVTRAQVDAYARASGDHNPIHLDEAFASKTPFGRTIAHGMLVLAFISEMMTHAYGKAWLEGGSLKVRFKAPVYVGQRVSTFGALKRNDPSDGGRTVVYSVGCRTAEGEEVIAGEAALTISGQEGGSV